MNTIHTDTHTHIYIYIYIYILYMHTHMGLKKSGTLRWSSETSQILRIMISK